MAAPWLCWSPLRSRQLPARAVPPCRLPPPLSSETAEAAILRGHREAAAPGEEALPSATVSLEGEDLPGGVAKWSGRLLPGEGLALA
eukprot:14298474-Alexandrium_andersonii.AAC.1